MNGSAAAIRATRCMLTYIAAQTAGALLAFAIIRAAYEPSAATNRSSAKPRRRRSLQSLS